MTVDELAALVGGRVVGDGSTRISGVAGIHEGASGDITFLGDRKYLAALKVSNASAAIVPLDFGAEIRAVQIRVENPARAFAQVLEKFAPAPIVFEPGIHPSAIIGSNVVLGQNVSIQPHVVIESGASIGDFTVIGANVYIGHNTAIGQRCRIHPNVSIRENIKISDRVTIHSGAVIGSRWLWI